MSIPGRHLVSRVPLMPGSQPAVGGRFAEDNKTRSIDLARRIVMELAESEARTKDGDVCVGKDDILKITNKRRLYDVTGPLEAMGLVLTTKINIVWTGCRIGAFAFVPSAARNFNFVGKNGEMIARYGRRTDLPLPPLQRQAEIQRQLLELQLPKIPRKKSNPQNDLKEKLKFLLKRRHYLINEFKEKERANTARPSLSYNDICMGLEFHIKTLAQQTHSGQYSKAFPQLRHTLPNLYIISGDQQVNVFESNSELVVPCNLPEPPQFLERVVFEFSGRVPLEIHYIDNCATTISPAIGGLHSSRLRSGDLPQMDFTSPDYRRNSGSNNHLETPMLNELKFAGDFGGEYENM